MTTPAVAGRSEVQGLSGRAVAGSAFPLLALPAHTCCPGGLAVMCSGPVGRCVWSRHAPARARPPAACGLHSSTNTSSPAGAMEPSSAAWAQPSGPCGKQGQWRGAGGQLSADHVTVLEASPQPCVIVVGCWAKCVSKLGL